LTSIPFFWALYQGIQILTYIDANKAFSELSIKALKHIKLSAVLHSALFLGAISYIAMAEENDNPGLIVIGLIIVGASAVVATFAAILQKLVQNAVDLKSENDLTV
jgi:hypothetical protein